MSPDSNQAETLPGAPAAEGLASLVGRTIGRYTIEGRLGKGGMAAVFRGTDTELQRQVAVKVLLNHLLDQEGMLERFRREARMLAGLNHPNVVQVYDFGTTTLGDVQYPYLVAELVDGPDLKKLLDRWRKVPLEMALLMGQQMTRALAYAHEKGLVHRDIKPENFLAASDGRLKLSDFGIARSKHFTTLTAQGDLVGTLSYMAPEALDGAQVGKTADIFALGVILYEMLSGNHPFTTKDTSTPRLIMNISQTNPKSLDSFNVALWPEMVDLVERAVSKRPEDRFQDAAVLGREIDGLVEYTGVRSPEEELRPYFSCQPRCARKLRKRVVTHLVEQARLRRADGGAESQAQALDLLDKARSLDPEAPSVKELLEGGEKSAGDVEPASRGKAAALLVYSLTTLVLGLSMLSDTLIFNAGGSGVAIVGLSLWHGWLALGMLHGRKTALSRYWYTFVALLVLFLFHLRYLVYVWLALPAARGFVALLLSALTLPGVISVARQRWDERQEYEGWPTWRTIALPAFVVLLALFCNALGFHAKLKRFENLHEQVTQEPPPTETMTVAARDVEKLGLGIRLERSQWCEGYPQLKPAAFIDDVASLGCSSILFHGGLREFGAPDIEALKQVGKQARRLGLRVCVSLPAQAWQHVGGMKEEDFAGMRSRREGSLREVVEATLPDIVVLAELKGSLGGESSVTAERVSMLIGDALQVTSQTSASTRSMICAIVQSRNASGPVGALTRALRDHKGHLTGGLGMYWRLNMGRGQAETWRLALERVKPLAAEVWCYPFALGSAIRTLLPVDRRLDAWALWAGYVMADRTGCSVYIPHTGLGLYSQTRHTITDLGRGEPTPIRKLVQKMVTLSAGREGVTTAPETERSSGWRRRPGG